MGPILIHEQGQSIHVVDGLDLGEGQAEAMHEADRTGPPGDVAVHENGGDDEETHDMVDEECLLADRICAIHVVLHVGVEGVEETGQEQEHPREVIGPERGFEVRIPETEEAAEHEGGNHKDVEVDPDGIEKVVVLKELLLRMPHLTTYYI